MNHERLIQEQRTIEAMKKGYMGTEGKFAGIVKKIGYPIYQQGGRYHNQTFLEDVYAIENDEIPILDEDEMSYEIGWAFDGLSRGMDLSINFNFYHREIIVNYKGKIVYQEVSGDLEKFIPNEEWENHIDNLLLLTKKIDKNNRLSIKRQKQSLIEEKRKEILEKLKNKWGI